MLSGCRFFYVKYFFAFVHFLTFSTTRRLDLYPPVPKLPCGGRQDQKQVDVNPDHAGTDPSIMHPLPQ